MSTIYLNSGQQISPVNNQITWTATPTVADSGRWATYNSMGMPSWQDSGYFYAPYLPIATTPTIILDPDSFKPREGILTRYGKKLLQEGSKYYGKIKIGQVLDGEGMWVDPPAESRVPWQSGWNINIDHKYETESYEPGTEDEIDDSDRNVWREPEEHAARRSRLEAGVAKGAKAAIRFALPFRQSTLPARAIHRGTRTR